MMQAKERTNNTLYLECYSGISGDMTVAALLDLGADQEVLERAIKSLPLTGYDIKISRVLKSGIDACDFDVVLDAHHENYDHDMEYLHGDAKHTHTHSHSHGDAEHSHSHGEAEHTHSPEDTGHTHVHPHEHRGMKEIQSIIEQGEMTDGAKNLALRIFSMLAEAESKAHRKPVEEVHFHEVGAVDSIIDIVAAAVCLDNLKVDEVIVPKLYEGTGVIRCQHGMLPIPVPAVANIVQANHLNLQIMDVQGEFVTPTGAAIVAAVKTADVLPEGFTIERIGIGAGKREYERPSILRAMLIK